MAIFSRLLSIHSVSQVTRAFSDLQVPAIPTGRRERESLAALDWIRFFVNFLNDFLMTKDGSESQWCIFSWNCRFSMTLAKIFSPPKDINEPKSLQKLWHFRIAASQQTYNYLFSPPLFLMSTCFLTFPQAPCNGLMSWMGLYSLQGAAVGFSSRWLPIASIPQVVPPPVKLKGQLIAPTPIDGASHLILGSL